MARRLRFAIALRGLSIRDFSDLAQIPYRTMQDYLAGISKPGADQLAKLSAAGIDLNWLLTGRVPSILNSGETTEGLESSLDLFGADARLLEALLNSSYRLADQFAARRAASGGGSLTAKESQLVVAQYFTAMLRVAANMGSHLEELLKRGVPAATVIGVLETAVGERSDEKVETALKAASKPGPADQPNQR